MERSATSLRRPGLLAFALLAAFAVAGCGSSSSPSVASVAASASTTVAGTSDGGGGGGSGPPPSQDQVQQDALRFARCMRSHGVPRFPDPDSSGGFLFQSAGVDPSSPAVERARATCGKLLPGGGPPGPGTTTHPPARTLAHFLEVAQCMRRHGVPGFPDPRTSVPVNPFGAAGAGVISDIEGVIFVFPETLDTRSPVFTRAAAACKFPLHNR